MDIGPERERITVIPKEDPVPAKQPQPDREPVKVPTREPVKV